MNSSTDPLDLISRLTGRMLDGSLSDDELKSLADLLSSTPGGQEHFVLLCELNAMLESEPAIQETLGEAGTPENVISLPGSKSITSFQNARADAAGINPATRSLPRMAWAMGAAAALGLAALYGALRAVEEGSSRKEGILVAVPSAAVPSRAAPSRAAPSRADKTEAQSEKARTKEFADEKPETQYERAVLAALGTGSQKRPPTNFTVEPSASDDSVSFNRHIRPILSDNCFACHGPDEASRKAKLRLDTLEGATGGDSPAVIAGDPNASELIARIVSTDTEEKMPPAESHKSLTAKQIDLLTRWVAEGALWEDHWSFLRVTLTFPDDAAAHPVDFFVDEELTKQQLTRAKEADRTTLIRRATLDLTGLPPTPEEVGAFADDPDKDAYEKLIDGLLARPSFGEHRARYWLDAARYGDTHGLHLDNYREIWPYRDWVIGAFNDNMPFDQFTIEQLAGDLLPNATQDQRIATGFNRCNVTTSEGGAIEEEFLVRYAVDRVATTATVWMGLTAGCAQCHDHKFDPITMKDFYSLFAYFNNTTQPGMDGNAKDSAPVIRVYDSPEQEEAARDLRAKIEEVERRAKVALAEYPVGDGTLASIACDYLDHGKEEVPTDLEERGNFGKSDSFTVALRFALPESEGKAVLARRTDTNDKGRGWSVVWENQGILVEFTEESPGKSLKSGLTRRFKAGTSGHFAFSYDGSGRSNGIRLYHNGDPVGSRFVNQWHDSLVDDFKTESASLLVGGKDPESGLVPGITDFVVYERRLVDEEVKQLSSYPAIRTIDDKSPWDTVPAKEKEEWRRFLATWHPGTYRDVLDELSELRAELSRIESVTPTTLVMAEKPDPAKAHLLLRGEYEQKGDEVVPGVPAFLIPFESELPPNRLGLAQWLVHPEHPLTARVAVNRIWQELFGVGLVKTSDDFGTQGESPSHPELLDALAASFVQSGWDVKALYRTLMLSETYRQSSVIPEGMAQRDPENRLLARGPRFRLDAEVIRDQALAASGLIDSAVGGPSVKPYQPGGIWEAVGYTNSNTQTFLQDFGPSSEHRRSLYTFWKRTAHAPNLAILDAPNRESCVMRRERTNTPLQALVLMNDPQYVRASRYLALRVLGEESELDRRLDRMAELLRSRPLSGEERRVVVNSLDQFRNTYESDPAAAAELLIDEVNAGFSIQPRSGDTIAEIAAWTMVANQLQNLDEVLNKN